MVEFALDGNSQETINLAALLCLVGIGCAAALGSILDHVRARGGPGRGEAPGSRPFSVGLLLLASYALLVPGLWCVLFSFNIILDFGLIKLGVGPGGGIDKVPPVTESMLGLVHLLQSTDCPLGAAAVVLYAIVIPALKLLLLLLGECCCPRHPAAPFCVHVVQSISKWACPDMFAYIFLMYLVRGLNHPMMLRAAMRLDLGFTCFSLFCAGSTAASLGVRAADGEGSFVIFGPIAQQLGRTRILPVAAALAAGFLASLALGLLAPVMSLRVHLDELYAPRGPIPSSILGIPLEPVIEQLHIPEKANADVSLCMAILSLWEWMRGGEVNSFIALVMLALFVVALTVLDMAILVAAAAFLRAGRPARALADAAAVLRKLAMLDVLVMGVFVVTLCMSMYHKSGIFVSMHVGVAGLFCAELLHYLTYYTVMGAVQRFQPCGEEQHELMQLKRCTGPETNGLTSYVSGDPYAEDNVILGEGL